MRNEDVGRGMKPGTNETPKTRMVRRYVPLSELVRNWVDNPNAVPEHVTHHTYWIHNQTGAVVIQMEVED